MNETCVPFLKYNWKKNLGYLLTCILDWGTTVIKQITCIIIQSPNFMFRNINDIQDMCTVYASLDECWVFQVFIEVGQKLMELKVHLWTYYTHMLIFANISNILFELSYHYATKSLLHNLLHNNSIVSMLCNYCL